MKKEVQRFDLDEMFIWKNIERYIPKYIALNFKHYYYQKEDICHNVYIKVMRYRTFNEKKAKISTYLTMVARNHILDLDKKKKKRIGNGYVFLDKYDLLSNTLDYAELNDEDKIIDERDLRTHINAILDDFTRVERYIINEKYINGIANHIIYKYLNINNETFSRYLSKINIKLKDIFENSDIVINYCIDNSIEFDPVD